jgi:hypothetical protein
MVEYQGARVPLIRICEQKRISYRAIYDRYREVGTPEKVGDWLFGTKAEWLIFKAGFSLDGRRMTTRQIGIETRTSKNTVYRLAAKYGKALKSIHFETDVIAEREARLRKAAALKDYAPKPDRSPGWWEREHLADAGKNGFSKTPRGEGARVLM